MTNIIPDEAKSQVRNATISPRLADDGMVAQGYLARRVMRLAKVPQPIEYEVTNDPGLLHQYYRLREEMFISVWGLHHFTGQKDAFDDISLTMIARKGLQCVGGGRLTMASPAYPQLLPMEGDDLQLPKLFSELKLSENAYGEISRLAILPEFRNGAVFPEFICRGFRRAIAEGVRYIFNIAPQPLARSYRQSVRHYGFKFDMRYDIPVPDREEYEGIHMVLSVIDLSEFIAKKPAPAASARAIEPEKALAD